MSLLKSNKINKKKTFVSGILMGVVELIPGVSGSTIALILGIYDKFIGFIHELSEFAKDTLKLLKKGKGPKTIYKRFKEIDSDFGFILVLGMFTGIGALSHVMSFALEHFPSYTFAFFFSLVLASIRVPFKQVNRNDTLSWVVLGLSAAMFFIVLGLTPASANFSPNPIYLFIGGFFAISAMLLPGISGSFVLLLFGLYDYVISLIKDLTSLNVSTSLFTSLMIVGAGIVMGFLLFVRVIKYALSNFPSQLMAFLTGLMIASLRVLWPFVRGTRKNLTQVSPADVPVNELIVILVIIAITVAFVTYVQRFIKDDDIATL